MYFHSMMQHFESRSDFYMCTIVRNADADHPVHAELENGLYGDQLRLHGRCDLEPPDHTDAEVGTNPQTKFTFSMMYHTFAGEITTYVSCRKYYCPTSKYVYEIS